MGRPLGVAGLHIPRFAQWAKLARSIAPPSPMQTYFAGLCVGGRLTAAYAGRSVTVPAAASDGSGSNFCGGDPAGGSGDPPPTGQFRSCVVRWPPQPRNRSCFAVIYERAFVAVGAALCGRPSAVEDRFSCHFVGEGLALPLFR